MQQAPSRRPPRGCAVCEDERQYVGYDGQLWTTLSGLGEEGFGNEIRTLEEDLYGIRSQPQFAIGQRSLLVRTRAGNLLWDPVSLVDAETVSRVRELGGVQAISASHPHFYASMVEWSRSFDGAPIHLPAADREWVLRPDPAVRHYDDQLEVLGLALIRCGGHFEGSAVAHWPAGAGGRGVLLTGDTVMVVQDRRWVSFMRSYPNLIPISAAVVRGIVDRLEPLSFDRIYGNPGWEKVIESGAKAALRRSAERYVERLQTAG